MEEGDGLIWVTGIFLVIILLLIIFVFYPMAKPWYAQQSGKAELAQAEQNRNIAILEAKAKEESALHLANAEINRAKGVAEANKIIGESLKGNEDYLRYLWIVDVAGANIDKTVVYIPTENNLPILEANRLKQ